MSANQKSMKTNNMLVGIASRNGINTMIYLDDCYSKDNLPLTLTGTQKSGRNMVFNYQNK